MNRTEARDSDNVLPMPTQMVLLANPLSFDTQTLEKRLRNKTQNEEISVQPPTQGGSGALVVFWRKVPYAVMSVDKPIPSGTFSVALRTSYGLTDGGKLVAEHRAHLIISPLQQAQHQGQAIIQSIGLMELTELLAGEGQPLGYFWSNSETLIDQSQFTKAVDGVKAAIKRQADRERDAGSLFPANYWVGLRLFSPDQKTQFGALSKGLRVFTGFELEFEPIEWKPADIAQRLYGTVAYLFSNGPVLKDGQTLGVSDKEHFRIRKASATESLPPRLVLTLEPI